MKKAIFPLDTTAILFAQWLSDYTQSIHVRKFPVEYPEPQYPAKRKGYYSLQAVPPLDHDVGERSIVLEMNCLYMVETEKGNFAYPGFWAIRFKIVPFAPEKTKVTAECNNPAVMGYFKELLKELAWLFPKSREAIQAEIDRLISHQVQTELLTPAGDGAGNVKPQPPAMGALQDDWFSWFDQVTGQSSVKPDPPAPDAPNDLWFHWFHYITDVQGYKMTLQEIAREIGLEYGYMRTLHSGYAAQYDTKKTQK